VDPWVVVLLRARAGVLLRARAGVLLRARAGVLPCGDPWVVVQLSAQSGVPQYADQWFAALRPGGLKNAVNSCPKT